MNPFTDHYPGGFRRQHPYGNLQPLPGPVNDRHRAISSLRSAKDLNGGIVERVERIEDLDLQCLLHSGYCGRGCLHPHVHCVVPAGGLALDGSRWIASSTRFFLPVNALSAWFREQVRQPTRCNYFNNTDSSSTAHCSSLLSPSPSPVSPATLPKGLGRLCQATLRRSRACSELSGPLHPPRRHLQPSPGGVRERSSLLSLARLCPRRQATRS